MSLVILQTHSKLEILFFFFFSVFLFNFWKTDWVWSEFGDSPNSLQTHSKLCLNSICYFFGGFFLPFFEKNDFGQTHSKLGANWFCSLVSFLFQFSLEKMNFECQTLSKLTPNSVQTPIIVYVCSFSLLLVQIVVLKICLSLEKAWGFSNILFGDEQWIWSDFGNYSTSPQHVSKLIPSPSQTPMVSFFCNYLFNIL